MTLRTRFITPPFVGYALRSPNFSVRLARSEPVERYSDIIVQPRWRRSTLPLAVLLSLVIWVGIAAFIG